MKKTTMIFLVSLLVCGCVYLFTIANYHSMKFEMKHLSGDEKLLQDVKISSKIGNEEQWFDVLVENGTLTYAYERFERKPNDHLYIKADMNQEVDTSNLTFKKMDENDGASFYTDEEGNMIEIPQYSAELPQADVSVRVASFDSYGYDTYGYYNGKYLITELNKDNDLQVNATSDYPIRYEKRIFPGNEEVDGRVVWYGEENQTPCYEVAKNQFVGMLQINPQMEGTAHIYEITLKEQEKQLRQEIQSLLEIPITLGTNGILYVYENKYNVVLQHDDVAMITQYDAKMKKLYEVEIPLVNAKQGLQFFGDQDMLILQSDTLFTAFDTKNKIVVDQITMEDNMDLEDCVYRNGRFYFSAIMQDEKGQSSGYDTNRNILVYEQGEKVYQGEVYLQEKKPSIEQIYMYHFQQYNTTFVRDAS